MEKACYRCSQCGTDWPNVTSKYRTCPVCGTATSYMWNGYPMSEEDAAKYVHYLRFDRYYLETRGVDADNDSSPELDPFRGGLGDDECTAKHEDGFFCWHCDSVPRRLSDETLYIAGTALTCGDKTWDIGP